MTEHEEYQNYPKAELMRDAQKAIDEYALQGVHCEAYFKASCPKCGERCSFTEPNIAYDSMECFACGTDFPFTEGNYYLLLFNQT
jgi:PHP family Zn ribbon phosphoesterase